MLSAFLVWAAVVGGAHVVDAEAKQTRLERRLDTECVLGYGESCERLARIERRNAELEAALEPARRVRL